MTSRNTDVICYPDIGVLSSADLDLLLVFGINYIEDLLSGLLAVRPAMNRLKHYVVTVGLININYVDKSIAMGDSEREELFAQLTV